MSCPTQDQLHRYPWPGMSLQAKNQLREHTEQCLVCLGTAHRLGFASAILRKDSSTLDRRRRAALWAAIEARTTAPQPSWPWALGLSAGAALVVALLLVARPEPAPTPGFVLLEGVVLNGDVELSKALPSGAPLRVKTAARIGDGSTLLAVGPGTEFRLLPLETIALIRGGIDLEVSEALAHPIAIATPTARIEAIGADFRVEVAAYTTVIARRGQLRITPQEGPAISLAAQDRWSDAPSLAAEAPLPTPEAKEAGTSGKAPTPARARNQADLERAHAIVDEDASGARRLAEGVLARQAAGQEEVDALAVIADAYRRSGEDRLAADFYGRVAAHPAGRGYGEEALLRRARLQLALGDRSAALSTLEEAQAHYASGPLAPERAAFTATIYLAEGDPERAAATLEASQGDSIALRAALRDVAQALARRAPARSARLLERSRK